MRSEHRGQLSRFGKLGAATRRVDNAALIATLSDLQTASETIVEQLKAERR
jgi:hypothetical protein